MLPPTAVSFGHDVDLDAPALVVGEVQVQHVELVEREQVDVLLHLVDGEEVARDVEHRAAPGEARMIGDAARRDRPRGRLRMLALLGLDRRGRSCRSVCDAWNSPAGAAATDPHESAAMVTS